jgi:hypothetical protein
MPSPQEFLILALVVGVLMLTGLWPAVLEALRELRGGGSGGSRSSAPADAQDLDFARQLMGVGAGATRDEIERAYRRKAQKLHPDHGGDEDAMRALNEAYARLKRARDVQDRPRH